MREGGRREREEKEGWREGVGGEGGRMMEEGVREEGRRGGGRGVEG